MTSGKDRQREPSKGKARGKHEGQKRELNKNGWWRWQESTWGARDDSRKVPDKLWEGN
jgi:hypothetical protein